MKVNFCLSAFAAIGTAAGLHHDGIVNTNGIQFELNGKPYSYAGTNTFWGKWISPVSDWRRRPASLTMNTAAFQANESLVEETFRNVHNVGYRVMRSVVTTSLNAH